MKLNHRYKVLLALAVFSLRFGGLAYGQVATTINGLYYTGEKTDGTLQAGGAKDGNWTVSSALVGGATYSGTSTYTGKPYVLSPSYIDGAYVPNTTTAQWITAPGAQTTTGTVNVGGDSLPGNGTTGNNSAYYVYKLGFNIVGSGSGAVSNQISISLTIAADDQYTVYVNPTTAPTVNTSGVINSGGTAASGSGLAAWSNTQSLALQDNMGANNANFVIGTNYLYIVVANTNSLTGTQGSNALNPSGLLVYQLYGDMTIDGRVVPEVGAWMPVVLAVGLFVRRRFFGGGAAIC